MLHTTAFNAMPYKLEAKDVYYAMTFVNALALAVMHTLSMVYQVQTVGLSPLQLVLLGTTLEASAFLFELPTGLMADIYGRRRALVIGFAMLGFGSLLFGAIPAFGPMVCAQIVMGIGFACTSGAEAAWIADEVGSPQVNGIYMRAAQVGQVATLLGIPISVALGTLTLQAPILVGGALFITLALGLAMVMPETRCQPASTPQWASGQPFIKTLRGDLHWVRTQPIVRLFLGVPLLIGLYSEGYDRLWTAHVLDRFAFPTASVPLLGALTPVLWFGVIRAVTQLLSLGATEVVRRQLLSCPPSTLMRPWSIVYTGMLLGLAMFALARSFWIALVALWLFEALRTLSPPLATAWINRYLTPANRATMLSLCGQVDAIGQVAGGPVIGWIGSHYSLRTALLTSSVWLALVAPLCSILQRQSATKDIA
jgi:DHA3 family tetracycline resistance protein-like MFS transporter